MLKNLITSILVAASYTSSVIAIEKANAPIFREENNIYFEIGKTNLQGFQDTQEIGNSIETINGMQQGGTGAFNVYFALSNFNFQSYAYQGLEDFPEYNNSIMWVNMIITHRSYIGGVGYTFPLIDDIGNYPSRYDFERLLHFEVTFSRYQATTSFGISMNWRYYSRNQENTVTGQYDRILSGDNYNRDYDAQENLKSVWSSVAKWNLGAQSFRINAMPFANAWYELTGAEQYVAGYDAGYNGGYGDGWLDGRNTGYEAGQIDGYNNGYNIGFSEGMQSSENGGVWNNLFTAVLAPFSLLSLEIFPGVTLGMIALIPIVFGLIAFIFKLGGKGNG